MYVKKYIYIKTKRSEFSFLACHANMPLRWVLCTLTAASPKTVVLSNTTRGWLGIPLETTAYEYQNQPFAGMAISNALNVDA